MKKKPIDRNTTVWEQKGALISPTSEGSAAAKSADKRRRAAAPAGPRKRRRSKLDQIIGLLRGRRGASIDALAKATGWQKHSVRGAIAGAIKKKLGLKVLADTRDGKRTYRITR